MEVETTFWQGSELERKRAGTPSGSGTELVTSLICTTQYLTVST